MNDHVCKKASDIGALIAHVNELQRRANDDLTARRTLKTNYDLRFEAMTKKVETIEEKVGNKIDKLFYVMLFLAGGVVVDLILRLAARAGAGTP